MSSPIFAPIPPGRLPRIEYLDFQDVGDHREYRLAVCGPEGPAECRFRIAIAAFGAGRMRLQDGPDLCYRKLLKAITAGETTSAAVVTIDEVELVSYREAHTHLPKHRTWTSSTPPRPAYVPPVRPRPTALPPAPVAVSVPRLDEGQRVSHAVFGVGVTTSSTGGHTVVCFDQDGPKTFVTSMLELEVLSAPHTWETGRQGKNRLRKTPLSAH